jgi:hypothetical protein
MSRIIAVFTVSFALVPIARAQDMPLSQIVIDGQGWKKTAGKPPAFAFSFRSVEMRMMNQFIVRETYTIGEKTFRIIVDQNKIAPEAAKHGDPTSGLISLDGGTVFIGHDTGYIWAYQVKGGGTLLNGHPYCPVRVAKVEGKTDPDTQPSLVSSMTGDKDGRIYAATPLGVQVFDPTGRLCGVLTPAAPGKAEYLKFEGDKLTLWIGDQKYERKLNTLGVK